MRGRAAQLELADLRDLAALSVCTASTARINDKRARVIADAVLTDTIHLLRTRIVNTIDPELTGPQVKRAVLALLDRHTP